MLPNLRNGRAWALAGLILLVPQLAPAQPIGVRASGLAGAFVAVADDASSVYWNPAGMATGAFVSFVLDYGDGWAHPEEPGSPDGGFEERARMIAFTLPPVGLGYYRLGKTVAEPRPAGSETTDREEGRRTVHGLETSHAGLTLAQSLTDYLVVAGTFKYVRGEVSSGLVTAASAEEALDAADGLPTLGTSRFDVDAGVMLAVERVRAGLVARNLTAPSFDSPDPGAMPVELDREVRVGAAWGDGWPGLARLIVSVDADLTRQQSASGERRDVAAGVETWWLGQRLGVRGGVKGSTIGSARMLLATGLSAGISSGIFLEGHVAAGEAQERSWSVGARIVF